MFSTFSKGAAGFFAVTVSFDPTAFPYQVVIACSVSALMGVSLCFDIKKKYRDDREYEKQNKRDAARREFFRHKQHRKKNTHEQSKNDSDKPIEPISPTNI